MLLRGLRNIMQIIQEENLFFMQSCSISLEKKHWKKPQTYQIQGKQFEIIHVYLAFSNITKSGNTLGTNADILSIE